MCGYYYSKPLHKETPLNKLNYPSLPELLMMTTQGNLLMMKNTGEKLKGSSSDQMYSQKWKQTTQLEVEAKLIASHSALSGTTI